MKDIPCEVIRDLMPSYIDGLTGEKTNEIIKNHLSECPECRKILERMKGPDTEDQPEEREIREIDFMKKNRKRNKRIVLFSAFGAAALFILVCALRFFLIGADYDGNVMIVEKITVEDGVIHFKGTPSGSAEVITGVRFDEKEGIVTIHGRTALVSIFHKPGKEFTYQLKDTAYPLKQIRLGDKIIWEDGSQISSRASLVYPTRHSYMGDMSANVRTAEALSASMLLGPYENQLKSAEEPYGWILRLKEDIPENEAQLKENDMESISYIMLGMIENLGYVSFEYSVDGVKTEKTITAEEASAFLGQDIKDCMNSIRVLDTLIEKTGL